MSRNEVAFKELKETEGNKMKDLFIKINVIIDQRVRESLRTERINALTNNKMRNGEN